ncbi:glycosyl transferase [Virgisporangium aliadipatigenens]|uniref:Glycosyl transferase n=1 Tax=Virgisporangium aliadipatigenens TaxID=741659 RepID=A0A8J3YN06_9ACTN|nr:glycosyltransferase [Virgisporangium aliadipatigenens]GIJ47058.1 glycosyl transferase [Virgisporangium aliadipatigenens]
MNILFWHVHGAWATAFVHGGHTYLVPVNAERDADGLGRARTYPWPENAVEVTPERLSTMDVDVAVLQRPHEYELMRRWLGGRRVPVVYVEHNTPKDGAVPLSRHPMADRDDVTLVHVTHFNRLFWDAGGTRTTVIEHGIPDPGVRWTGELSRIAVAINEPVRRGRVTGTDLLAAFTDAAPLDLFGMGVAELASDRIAAHEDPPQADLHREMARRRLYLHPHRWTSLGLSLLEAMTIGMPVVVLATTEAVRAVPPEAGAISTDPDELLDATRWLMRDDEAARRCGAVAREAALRRYGLARFLSDWDALLKEVIS